MFKQETLLSFLSSCFGFTNFRTLSKSFLQLTAETCLWKMHPLACCVLLLPSLFFHKHQGGGNARKKNYMRFWQIFARWVKSVTSIHFLDEHVGLQFALASFLSLLTSCRRNSLKSLLVAD